jgi:ABC-2 type transport system permease protein
MRKMLDLFRWNLRREKIALIITVGASLVILLTGALIMDVSSNNFVSTNVAVTDEDHTAVSEDMIRYLADDLQMEVITDYTGEEIQTALVEKDISAAITIPAGYQDSLLALEPTTLPVTVLGDYENAAFVQGYLDRYAASLAELAVGADGSADAYEELLADAKESAVKVNTVEKNDELLKKDAQMDGFLSAVGFYIMFSFMLMISLSAMLISDRKNGTFRRIKAANVSSLSYTGAYVLVGLLGAMLMLVVPLAACRIAGIYTGVPFGAMVLILFCYAVFVVAFGLLIGIITPSINGALTIIIAVCTITSMLGGAWFPIETAPKVLQMLGRFTPQYWVLQTLQDYQGSGGSLLAPVSILLLASVLCFILSGVRFASARAGARVA